MHRLSPLCVLAFALLAFLPGCATGPAVVSTGSQTFTVSAEDTLKWNTTTATAREIVFETANRYCTKHKLVLVPVSLDLRPGEVGVKTGTADLAFLALPPGHPEIARTSAILRQYDPMVVRESVVKFEADGTSHPIPPKP